MEEELRELRRALLTNRARDDQYRADIVRALRSLTKSRLMEVMDNYSALTPERMRELPDEDLAQVCMFARILLLECIDSAITSPSDD